MTIHAHPRRASTPPMPAVARILARYDRASLESFLSVAIDLLDTMDGDPDFEEDDPPEDSDVDRCPAHDDDPAFWASDNEPGDPDDREDSDQDCCEAADDGCGAVWRNGQLRYGSERDEPLEEFSEEEVRAEHCHRIQRTRCTPVVRMISCYWGAPRTPWIERYRLEIEPSVPTFRHLRQRKPFQRRKL